MSQKEKQIKVKMIIGRRKEILGKSKGGNPCSMGKSTLS